LASRVETKMAQGSNQPLSFGRRHAPVDVAAEHRGEIEHLARQRPAACKMTAAFGGRGEADEQCAVVRAVGWRRAKLVFPERDAPPGAQFIRTQAEHVRVLAGPGNKFEINEPYFLERGELRPVEPCRASGHGPPIS